MLEEMTLEELLKEQVRALQLAAVCRDHGYAQAATIHDMTARALLVEIDERGKR